MLNVTLSACKSILTDDRGRREMQILPLTQDHEISDRRVSTALSTFIKPKPNKGTSFRITAFIYRLQTDAYEDVECFSLWHIDAVTHARTHSWTFPLLFLQLLFIVLERNCSYRKGLWFMCTLCCAPSYTERPEICVEMCSEFALFQSCLLGHSCPLVHAPLQGHRYCPLAKSVRPSLTQIRFLPKWDFYCSIRAGSRISLPQPFPVSSRRGSAALLQFFFLLSSLLPLPHLPQDKSGTPTAKNFACVGQVLISKNEKSSLKKKRKKKKETPSLFGLLFTQARTQTQAATSTLILHLIF